MQRSDLMNVLERAELKNEYSLELKEQQDTLMFSLCWDRADNANALLMYAQLLYQIQDMTQGQSLSRVKLV